MKKTKPPPFDPPTYDSFLRLNDVMERTGLRKTTIYERMREGTFPKSVSLGGRSVAWTASSIKVWMLRMIEESSE